MAGFAAANAAVNQTQGAFSQFGEARPEPGTPVAPAPAPTPTPAPQATQQAATPQTSAPSTKYKFTKKDLQGPSHFAPIPEGTYTFTVLDCKTDYTKKNGTSMEVVDMQVIYEGNKIWLRDYFVMSDNQMWKTGRFFASIGLWDALEANGLDGVNDPMWTTAISMEGKFEIEHETYNGKIQNKIKAYVVPGNLAVR